MYYECREVCERTEKEQSFLLDLSARE